jgi:hypothetical protein
VIFGYVLMMKWGQVFLAITLLAIDEKVSFFQAGIGGVYFVGMFELAKDPKPVAAEKS